MIVGYKLVRDVDSVTVQQWGGVYGSVPAIPNPLFLPNGDQVHAPSVGVSYDGHTIIEWQVSELLATADTISQAKKRIAVFADSLAAVVTGPVPETERASWPTKEVAARAYLAGTASTAQTSMLETEASLTNETATSLANKIVTNAESYLAIAGMIAGQRRVAMSAVDSLVIGTATVQDVENVLSAAKAQAEAMLAQILNP